jgi:hypothetical protein
MVEEVARHSSGEWRVASGEWRVASGKGKAVGRKRISGLVRRPIFVISVVLTIGIIYMLFWDAAGWGVYWLIKLPRTRDSRLVGTWKGTWRLMDDPELRPRVTTLRNDGTGECVDHSDIRTVFEWGTEDGRIYTRRMATDAWSGRSHAYKFSADDRNVWFSPYRMFDTFSSEMHRG